MRFISAIILTVVLLASAGCMVGPDYKTPDTELPESFQDSGAKDFSTDAIEIEWWSGFNDPVLDKLIHEALEGSYDIQIATARILEARALRTETEFQLAPIVPFNATYTKQQVGESTVFAG